MLKIANFMNYIKNILLMLILKQPTTINEKIGTYFFFDINKIQYGIH